MLGCKWSTYVCMYACIPSHLTVCCRTPTTVMWLSLGGMAIVYLTDWKVVLGKIPYVKGRFPPEAAK